MASDMKEEKQIEFKSKYILSDEEILSRGVNKEDISAYRQHEYNDSYSISKWIHISQLNKHTFDTEIIQLSIEEARSMLILCRYNQSLYTNKNKNSSQIQQYESKKK
eukprot:447192_1